MEINLFTCTAPNEVVDKSSYISNRFLLEGSFRQSSSVIDPVIIIEKTNPAIFHYNYMYIPQFARYYYINNIETIRTNLWQISAHVDVLYTWRADLQNMQCVIDKTADYSSANLYMDDGSFILDARRYNQLFPFSTGLSNDGEFILICAGGAGSEG